ITTVRSDGDLDDGIVKSLQDREGLTDAEPLTAAEVDNSFVLVGKAQLPLGEQHAVGLDAANDPLPQVQVRPRNIAADRCEDRPHSASGVGRSTDDLYLAFRRLHSTDLQTIGIGMRVGADDPCNCEGTQLCRTILNTLDFEAEHGKAFDNLLQGGLSFEVVLQPAERELHGVTVPAPSRVLPAAESRSASASGYHFRRRA